MDPYQYSHHPQRQVPQVPPYPRQPPPPQQQPPPPPQHIANPPPAPQASYNAKPFLDLISSVSLQIERSETRSAQRFSTMEMAIGSLSKLTADTLELLQVTRQESKDGFERFFKESKDRTESIHSLIRQAVHASMTKSERIEHILGDPDALDSDDSQSSNVLGRIARLECAMMELTESVSDPDAARPTVVRHEAAVNTSPQVRPTADVGTDAIDLLPSVAVVESGVQAGALTYRDAEIEARPESPVRFPTGSQTVWGPISDASKGGAIFSTYKPLGPAAWTPSDHDSDDRSDTRSESNCKTPAPIAQAPTSYTYRPVAAPATLHQSQSASSVFDEQEIVDVLQPSRDSVSQCAPSSPHMPAGSSPSSPAVRASLSLPLPRRDVISQASPPPSSPVTLHTPTAVIPIVQRAAILPEVPALPPGANILSDNSTSPCVISLPRGLARPQSQSSNPSLSSPLTPMSWTHPNSPTRPATAPPEPPSSPLSSPLSSPVISSAMSSLSSLDSTDSSETRVQVPGPAQSQKGKANSTSASVESVTTRVSKATPGASTSASADVSVSASASVKVKVKKERDNDSVTRPAKKRKRLDCASERRNERGSTSAKSARAGSSAGRARGRNARGGAPKGGKRTAPLVVYPLEETTASGSGSGRGGPSSSVPAQMDGRDGAKKRYSPPRIGTDCPWPLKLKGEEGSHREFVQCDACEGWYHFGCVGLTPDDPRLEPDAEFICPPCESSSEACEQRRNVRFQAAACLRPDCDHPGGAEDTNEYFVERIIGRRPYRTELDVDVKQPTAFMWLVKWDGWKADQATWAANEHLGECSRIIEEFEQAAEIEGRNLSAANGVILLNEAAAAGWGRVR